VLSDEGDRRALSFNGCDFRHAREELSHLLMDLALGDLEDQGLAVVRELRCCELEQTTPRGWCKEGTTSQASSGGDGVLKARGPEVNAAGPTYLPAGSGKQAGSTAQRTNCRERPKRQFDR
jgi:hypothetical protein